MSSNNGPTQLSMAILTPKSVRPHSKAEVREKSNKGRAQQKSCVITDTPEKLANEAEKPKERVLKTNLTIKQKKHR